ncbi:hypothetical protein AVEN_64199-1 [Araneus ventricosus]|uniref:Uncharacterized protein n=1 Tax=Araneus ventricosus TaxID=182803 RepID=A0A4Y2VN06_ARAVE|nr:hypothetical protein AVEN_64199-1 [Araneus ventricosus]
MDSSAPFPLFSSLRVAGDMNGRPSISVLSVPLMTTHPTAFSPLSEQKPAEIRPASVEVAWPVTASIRSQSVELLITDQFPDINIILFYSGIVEGR